MKNKYKMFFSLRKELRSYEQVGAKITVNGENVPAEYAAMVCAFREQNHYMRDYIFNNNGEIIEVGFVQVGFY